MLCLSLGTVAFASGDSKVLEDDSALTPSVFQEQAAAQDAYSKLCASFKLTEDGSYVYPDDYAGAWYEMAFSISLQLMTMRLRHIKSF